MELDPRYDHKEIEDSIYKQWEESGYFNPDRLPPISADSRGRHADKRGKSQRQSASSQRKSAFSIIMPPPNANGSLHVGHAVFVTLQDIMIRFARMRGQKALWLPGADHAGFETQVVFDKKLEKEGKSRFRMDREEVYKAIWDFTQENKKIMEGQLRKLGASCDWSREKFTLDPEIVKIVYETFAQLYKDGLAYRDFRVVNWCPKHKTALSDLEIKYVERTDPLYYIRYGPLTLATVRPETKFGDTALAVNPGDKRYKKYIGKEIEAEGILGPLKFKVIADEAVDPAFGTGVVKVTPAHDATDFEIWQRHKDEIPGPKIIINENGRLTGETGPFHGLKVAEAREKVAAAMQEKGILEKVDPAYVHQIATCYKCGSTLEPLPRMQWFVRMSATPTSRGLTRTSPLDATRGERGQTQKKTASEKSLRDLGIEAVTSGKIKFIPKRMEKVYLHWLKNIRDWNVSRQIVWGIRIPAWFCLGCGDVKINPEIKSSWFLVRHGETDANKNSILQGLGDDPLNDAGKAQAEKTAEALKNTPIDLIISSNQKRARETAEIISKTLGDKEIIIEEELHERSMGDAEGVARNEAIEKYGKRLYDYEVNDYGGESYKEVEKRAWAAFQKHQKIHKHKNVIVVSHGGTIRMLMKQIRGLTAERALTRESIKNAQAIQFDILEPCEKCGNHIYEQDPDVFDTWFSSGQWPFATLLKSKSDFEEFYPTDIMETAYDILFFWVTRMVMLGIYRTGKVPFKTVYLHGLVRDKDRQKMSKSKGNVIDPLGVAETYGTDALRMALVVGNTPGNDIVISEDKIRAYRNFATKIWNISRFLDMRKPKDGALAAPTAWDKKTAAELAGIKKKVTAHLEKFEYHRSAELLYHYIWHALADKHVETAKSRLQGENLNDARRAYATLETCLLTSLKLLHPFMPFITETLYQKFRPGTLLMIELW